MIDPYCIVSYPEHIWNISIYYLSHFCQEAGASHVGKCVYRWHKLNIISYINNLKHIESAFV